MDEDVVQVEFIKDVAQYNTGEKAGFPPERAKAMIEGKLAVAYTVPKPSKKDKE